MKRADITLVNVSLPLPSEVEKQLDVYLPLGCLYLVSALERAGYRVDFRDYQLFALKHAKPLAPDALVEFLADPAPIVGISCMVSMLPFVLLGTKLFRERHPDAHIILGGPGPSGVARAIVEAMPWVDAVARGEGEETIVELLGALRDGGDLSGVKGLAHRGDGGRAAVRSAGREMSKRGTGTAVENPPRARMRDLDAIPLPAYHAVDMTAYTSVSIVTGRGCPLNCAFCDVGPLWDNRVYLRSVGGVVAELDLLRHTYGRDRVSLADDTFTLARGRTEALVDEMGGLDLKWSCLSRIDKLDDDLLARMTQAGCDAIFLGIESGSNDVLAKISKRFTIQEATEKVEMATKHLKRIVTSYIWGFPFETMEDFKSTIFSIVSMWHLGAMAGLKLLSPMPLSRLGIEYRDQIEFSERLCSVFASLGNIAPGMSGKPGSIPQEFQTIIRQHPDIFEGFYYIKSDSLDEKAKYLEKFCAKFGIAI
ncbi:MAG TPA: radical SAM protein [bacterium]|nr:radical SAM protein [bacterium]